jgi:hypothetical protein
MGWEHIGAVLRMSPAEAQRRYGPRRTFGGTSRRLVGLTQRLLG